MKALVEKGVKQGRFFWTSLRKNDEEAYEDFGFNDLQTFRKFQMYALWKSIQQLGGGGGFFTKIANCYLNVEKSIVETMGLELDYETISFPSQENLIENVPQRIETYDTAGAWTASIFSLGISHLCGAHDYVAEEEKWVWPQGEYTAALTRKNKIIRNVKLETVSGKGSYYVYDKGNEFV